MTKNSEYQRTFKDKMKEEGRERLEMWPKAHNKPVIKQVAAGLDNELFDKQELEMWLRAMGGCDE